jgi:nucleotide-binding universal stress UspA family protein
MTILCATRGGEHAIYAQQKAIELATERNDDIIFFYVTDVSFLNHAGAAILVDVEAELDKMAEFLLLMAKERAEKAGVKADTLIEHGVFRNALKRAAVNIDATTIVLGTPDETSITEREFIDQLAADLHNELGIEVVIADNP